MSVTPTTLILQNVERSPPLLIPAHTQYQGVSTADTLAKATLRQTDKAIKTVPINAP